MTATIIQVALATPFRRLFEYKTDQGDITPGTRVSIPFGHQKAITGIAIKSVQQSSTPANKLKAIHQVLDNAPVLDNELLALCQWCADYYHYPLGEVCQLALPALLRKPEPIPQSLHTFWEITESGNHCDIETLKRAPKQRDALALLKTQTLTSDTIKQQNITTSTLKALIDKGLASKTESEQTLAPYSAPEQLLNESPLTLNKEQQDALNKIEADQFNTYLLNGVTGSGKTEVYLQAIEKIIKNDQQVLVLIPEIGLTPQTASRFEQRFQLPITTLHSGLSDKQRLNHWNRARSGHCPIIIGTRSSIFTPLPNLGLIIVDEEHDLSYKQQEGVRYSARDLAIVRAQKRNIPLILGSATPSLESLHNALSNRYQLLPLRQRANLQAPPDVELVETAETHLNEVSLNQIQQTLEQGKQVLVFINRRGYSPTLICQDCNWISQCPRCDSPMTLHRVHNQYLHCHHCDFRSSVPKQCSHCNSKRLQPLGSGTQRTEEQLEQRFHTTPVLRIDRDSISRKGQLETALAHIHEGQSCILVGTQMLAKGHHFAQLGLAIMLGIDSAFFSSDFRGAERMGQLLTQVAGRTGREKSQGKVMIQTRFADHPHLQQLIETGYNHFAQTLLAERKHSAMPPYEHLALIRCHAQQPELAQQFLQQARQQAEHIAQPHNGLQYLGPFPAAMEKRNNRYHFILQIKAENRRERQHLLQQLCAHLETIRTHRGLHWLVDIDPQEF